MKALLIVGGALSVLLVYLNSNQPDESKYIKGLEDRGYSNISLTSDSAPNCNPKVYSSNRSFTATINDRSVNGVACVYLNDTFQIITR